MSAKSFFDAAPDLFSYFLVKRGARSAECGMNPPRSTVRNPRLKSGDGHKIPSRCLIGLGWFAWLVLAVAGWAAPLTDQEAASAAKGWLRACRQPLKTPLSGEIAGTRTFRGQQGRPLYYVADLRPEGFVIISADTEIEPIIAFSTSGFYDAAPQSPLAALVQADLGARSAVKTVSRNKTANGRLPASGREKWDRLTRSGAGMIQVAGIDTPDDLRVAPFIQSHWNQRKLWAGSAYVACYNYYTPPGEPGEAENYSSGCTSTAWAQIMRYFAYPTQAIGTASFNIQVDGEAATRNLRGGDGSGGPYNWDQMPLAPGPDTTELEQRAIGALLADIGAACNTSYFPEGSAAAMSDAVLTQVFQYRNAMYAYGLDSDFPNKVHPNLDARIPVCFTIHGSNAWHALVGDGYGYNLGTLYYHLNLGWGGRSDAWYNLPTVDTDVYLFSSVDSLFYNIFPASVGEIISGRVTNPNGDAMASVVVTCTGGGQAREAVADAQGVFAFSGVPSDTTYNLSAAKPGIQFALRAVTTGRSKNVESTGNRWRSDLIGYAGENVRVISGRVVRIDDSGVPGVALQFSGGAGSAITDADGFFSLAVPVKWTGAATLSKAGHAFDPPALSFTDVTDNVLCQNVLATWQIFVDRDAVGNNDGSSWADAFTDLSNAMMQAPPGTEIWVAEGLYGLGTNRTDAFECKAGMKIFGGFRGDETSLEQRDWAARVTTLSGEIGDRGGARRQYLSCRHRRQPGAGGRIYHYRRPGRRHLQSVRAGRRRLQPRPGRRFCHRQLPDYRQLGGSGRRRLRGRLFELCRVRQQCAVRGRRLQWDVFKLPDHGQYRSAWRRNAGRHQLGLPGHRQHRHQPRRRRL